MPRLFFSKGANISPITQRPEMTQSFTWDANDMLFPDVRDGLHILPLKAGTLQVSIPETLKASGGISPSLRFCLMNGLITVVMR